MNIYADLKDKESRGGRSPSLFDLDRIIERHRFPEYIKLTYEDYIFFQRKYSQAKIAPIRFIPDAKLAELGCDVGFDYFGTFLISNVQVKSELLDLTGEEPVKTNLLMANRTIQ